MSEKPILFSAPMVRAILAGNKTQTRRIVKPQPSDHWAPRVGRYHPTVVNKRTGEEEPGPEIFGASDEEEGRKAKYAPGDLLWVKEVWAQYPVEMNPEPCDWWYRATRDVLPPGHTRWKSPIYMPREASRITLEVTAVRVERLTEISEGDAIAEGIACDGKHGWHSHSGDMRHNAPSHAFRALWESINGVGSWDLNPWVWVYECKRVKP